MKNEELAIDNSSFFIAHCSPIDFALIITYLCDR
jgi:hypothetical protein